MSYLIVRLKLTTYEKVVSLMNKLEKYDIVESVESHNESRPTPLALDEGSECNCPAQHAYMTYVAHDVTCPARLRQ